MAIRTPSELTKVGMNMFSPTSWGRNQNQGTHSQSTRSALFDRKSQLRCLNFRFAIFLEIRIVFCLNRYFSEFNKLIQHLVMRWHHLHCLVQKFATRLCHCIATMRWNALWALSVSIELISSSARVTSVKSAKRTVSEWVRETRTHRSDQGHLGLIKKESYAQTNGKYHPAWR